MAAMRRRQASRPEAGCVGHRGHGPLLRDRGETSVWRKCHKSEPNVTARELTGNVQR